MFGMFYFFGGEKSLLNQLYSDVLTTYRRLFDLVRASLRDKQVG